MSSSQSSDELVSDEDSENRIARRMADRLRPVLVEKDILELLKAYHQCWLHADNGHRFGLNQCIKRCLTTYFARHLVTPPTLKTLAENHGTIITKRLQESLWYNPFLKGLVTRLDEIVLNLAEKVAEVHPEQPEIQAVIELLSAKTVEDLQNLLTDKEDGEPTSLSKSFIDLPEATAKHRDIRTILRILSWQAMLTVVNVVVAACFVVLLGLVWKSNFHLTDLKNAVTMLAKALDSDGVYKGEALRQGLLDMTNNYAWMSQEDVDLLVEGASWFKVYTILNKKIGDITSQSVQVLSSIR